MKKIVMVGLERCVSNKTGKTYYLAYFTETLDDSVDKKGSKSWSEYCPFEVSFNLVGKSVSLSYSRGYEGKAVLGSIVPVSL